MKDDADLFEISCSEGHSFSEKLLRQMASALFNLFAGNMMREMNSNVHAKRKPGPQDCSNIRTNCDDKRLKLSGDKKN